MGRRSVTRFFYTLIFYFAVPVICLRLLWRSLAAPAYADRWAERFGIFPAPNFNWRDGRKVVWVHAVSVGEVIAALPLIRELQKNVFLQLVVTTTTPTGSERVCAALGDSVFHVYVPYDLPDAIARFLRRVKPSLLLIIETELWPNIIAACQQQNIPSLLVNGRLSEKSARGYQRWSSITKPMLNNLTLALIQHKNDAARFGTLGLPLDKIVVTGNIKFDLELSDELRERAAHLKEHWSQNGKKIVFIAASTHQGEDEIILDAFLQLKKTFDNLVLVIVPRHPERFVSVGALCESKGFSVARRSTGSAPEHSNIIIGDTMGELLLMYGASDIAFVGGSLVPNGGHNFIEPAAWRLPLISGPHVFNFADIALLLQNEGALTLVNSSAELCEQVGVLILNDAEKNRRGLAAFTVANSNRGALQKTLDVIRPLIEG
jgi:3-deoxy-D-manno-octulosonic-acid transferase